MPLPGPAPPVSMTGPEAAHARPGRRDAFVVELDAVHRPARPAAAPPPGGADRHRRHPDRPDRRPVPPGRSMIWASTRPPTTWRWPAGWSGSRPRCCCRGPGEEEGWEDPRAELVRRLLEYQQIKEIALWMARHGGAPGPAVSAAASCRRRPSCRRRRSRSTCSSCSRPSSVSSPASCTRSCTAVVARPLDVEGAMLRIQTLLAEREETSLGRGARSPADHRGCPFDPARAAGAGPPRRAPGPRNLDPFRPLVIRRESARAAD